jgi:hypothetical protein
LRCTASLLVTTHALAETGPNDSADAESDRTRAWEVEIAGQARYTTSPIRGGTTPFGFGVGVRGGVVFKNVYLGLTASRYFGASDVDISDYSYAAGLEAGYDFGFEAAGARFAVRPQLGVGGTRIVHVDPSLRTPSPDVVTSASSRGSGASDTATVDNVYLQPGITFLVAFGAPLVASGAPFAAVNANSLILPGIVYGGADSKLWVTYGLEGQIGLRF